MKHIKIERAKKLEQLIGLFTSSNYNRIDGEWELQNEDGTKHEKSDEFVKAVETYHQMKEVIYDILYNI